MRNCGIDTVAMQSTGVYWLPVYEMLAQRGLRVFLMNSRHTKKLPGRKSDVQECQWLMKLHTYGLLNNSFRPSEEICVLRTYWRQRDDHVKAASAAIQLIQKVLTEMNVQIANVISDISGVTGMGMLDAILAGERDQYKLAALADPRMQASEEDFASWLRLCPDNKITGGRIYRRGTRHVENRAAAAFRMAATSLWRSKTYLGAKFKRLRTRLGAPKAITAMAHSLARLVYRMLKYGQEYVDKGMEFYQQRYQQQQIRWLQNKAKDLGLTIALAPVSVAK